MRTRSRRAGTAPKDDRPEAPTLGWGPGPAALTVDDSDPERERKQRLRNKCVKSSPHPAGRPTHGPDRRTAAAGLPGEAARQGARVANYDGGNASGEAR